MFYCLVPQMIANKAIQQICEEYEQWLQDDLIVENYIHLLNESKEDMFTDFDKITKTLYKGYKKNGLYNKDSNGIYQLENNFNFDKDSFLNNVKLVVIFEKNTSEQGFFLYNKSWYNLMTDKIEDVVIGYRETKYNFPKIDEKKFYNTIFHELQHVYRQYQKEKEIEIKKSNNIEVKPKINSEDYIYDSFKDDKIENFIKNLMYLSNTNELDSHFSEIYPYLKFNKKINFKNYKQYLEVIPSYDIVQRLKEYQYCLSHDYIEQNPFIREKLSERFYEIYKNNPFYQYKRLTPDSCFRMLKNRIDNTLLYAEKKFYQYLKAALNGLKRKK